MMRIAFVTSGLNRGGAERQLLLLTRSLIRLEQVPIVISLGRHGTLTEHFRSFGVTVIELGSESGKADISLYLRLRMTLRKIDPDIIQGWMYFGNFASTIASFGMRLPIVWGIRGMSAHLYPLHTVSGLYHSCLGLLSRYADAIVHNSTASSNSHTFHLNYPSISSRVIPNGFDTDYFSPSGRSKNQGSITFGWLGRYHSYKDIQNVLKAAKICVDSGYQINLLLAGDRIESSNEELMGFVNALSLLPYVQLLGRQEDPLQLFHKIDCLVLSSITENFPNVIGEAMCCSTPCISTDVGDCNEIIGSTGYVVPARNSQKLADAMLAFSKLEIKVRQDIGQRARHRMLANYSIEKTSQQYLDLYQSLSISRGKE
jgi:glycosyltransferase involved in cell wall biosynthesis